MAFIEDLDAFFIDFTDSVIYDNAEYKGILDQPDEMIADNILEEASVAGYKIITKKVLKEKNGWRTMVLLEFKNS